MKTILIIFAASLMLTIGCNKPPQKISEPSPDEIDKIQPLGKQLSQELLVSLKTELQAAIADGGFEKAISVCNLKALPLTAIVEKSSKKNFRIKRTTNHYRNPLNAPDEFEKLALDHFEGIAAHSGELPENYIQKVVVGDSTFFYYYRPLKIENLCLGCHGKTENMDPSIVSQIAALYPGDKAIGYSEGDFRGLVSVKVPE